MLNKEYEILEPFTRKPWKKLTFGEVKKLSRNRSTNYVHSTLKRFTEERILQQERIGNIVLYSVANNINALNTLGFVAEHKAHIAKHLPHENMEKLAEKIKTPFYTLLITGSYAKKKQTDSSDLDVIIICDDKQQPNYVLAQIRLSCELMIPEVHPYVFKQSEFFQMLVNKEGNYGKEAARNNLILTGAKQYYEILLRAINNGFNG